MGGLFVLIILILAAAMILPFMTLVKIVGFIAALLFPIKFTAQWITRQETSLLRCVFALTMTAITFALISKFTTGMFMVGKVLSFAGGIMVPAGVYAVILETTFLKGLCISTVSGILTLIGLLLLFQLH